MADQSVFVSYSRRHESLVTPLVKLLRIGDRLVFQDVTSVELGSEWEPAILEALNRATFIIIIWCCHAAISEWIRKELNLSIDKGKSIIPVRIDKTPLPDELGRFQGLDLSEEINHRARAGIAHGLLTFALLVALALLVATLSLSVWPKPGGSSGNYLQQQRRLDAERTAARQDLDRVQRRLAMFQSERDDLEWSTFDTKTGFEPVKPVLEMIDRRIEEASSAEAKLKEKLLQLDAWEIRLKGRAVASVIAAPGPAAKGANNTWMLIGAAVLLAAAMIAVLIGALFARRRMTDREQGQRLAATVLNELAGAH
jgi:hypothetical protein